MPRTLNPFKKLKKPYDSIPVPASVPKTAAELNREKTIAAHKAWVVGREAKHHGTPFRTKTFKAWTLEESK